MYQPEPKSIQNYAGDTLAIAAAGIIGILYGATAAAIFLGKVAAWWAEESAKFSNKVLTKTAHNLTRAAPISAVGNIVGGALTLATIATLMLAFAAIVTPLLIVSGPILATQHARDNPRAGLLNRVFGGFSKVCRSAIEFRNSLTQLQRNKRDAPEIDSV